MISKGMENFEDNESLVTILSLEYPSANMGLAKAKKWIAKSFDLHDEEIDGDMVIYDDLGDVIYFLDPSAISTEVFSLASVVRFLNTEFNALDSESFNLFSHIIQSMSALERKWFIRYLLRTPRNGINEGTVLKVLAKHYDKTQAEVKKHRSYNNLTSLTAYYMRDETPPMILEHGTFVKPMLAKAVPTRKWPKNRIVDFKYDGNRYQIHRSGSNVIVFNRKGRVVTQQYPDIVETVLKYEADNFAFDGEIYPINSDGTPAPFQKLGTRVHSKNHAEAVEKCPVKWVIFDCLKIEGKNVMDLPYTERLEAMKNVPDQAERQIGGDPMAFYNRAIAEGFEGIIVKDASAPYQPGKRSVSWAKHKPPRIELDVVVISATYGEGKRSGVFGRYEIAVRDEGTYTSIGWVGTGFSEADLIRLTNDLRRNVDSYKNNVFSFLPRVVLEVSADIITRDTNGNIGLRFPRVTRIRDDKFPQDVNTIEEVMEMM